MRTLTTRRLAPPLLALALALLLALASAPGGTAEATGNADEPDGFSAEVLAPHATFTDEVSAKLRVRYDRGDAIVADLPSDASTVVMAEVTWEPGGTSGWHTHPGPAVVNVVEGEVSVTNASDCVTRTYAAGEAFLDPGQGNVHIATNESTTDEANAYVTFFGVPDGEPVTIWSPPTDCLSQHRMPVGLGGRVR
jgi:quercetin dioxygenase-like cupin family protein